ncbi:MAG: proprotein convertase P-domain-containing protein [Polyangiaceae bacterium]
MPRETLFMSLFSLCASALLLAQCDSDGTQAAPGNGGAGAGGTVDGGTVGRGCADPDRPQSEGSQSSPVAVSTGALPFTGGIKADQGPSYYRMSGLKPGSRYVISVNSGSSVRLKVFQEGSPGTPTCHAKEADDALSCRIVPKAGSIDIHIEPWADQTCFQLDATLDSPQGAFEGATDALLTLRFGTPDLPHRGIVDHDRSYYRLTELAPNRRYTVWLTGLEQDLTLLAGTEDPLEGVVANCQDWNEVIPGTRSCTFVPTGPSYGVSVLTSGSATSSRYVLNATEEFESEGTSAPKVLPFGGGLKYDGQVSPRVDTNTPGTSEYQVTGLVPGARYLAALRHSFGLTLRAASDAGFAPPLDCNTLGSAKDYCNFAATTSSTVFSVSSYDAHARRFTLHVQPEPSNQGTFGSPMPVSASSFPFQGTALGTSEYLISSVSPGLQQITLLDTTGRTTFAAWPASAQSFNCSAGGTFFPRCTLAPDAAGQLRVRVESPGSFELGLVPAPMLLSDFTRNAGAVPIPNGDSTGMTDVLVVAGSAISKIQQVRVELYVAHGHPQDLTAILIAPDGTTEVLLAKDSVQPYDGVFYSDYALERFSGLQRDGTLDRLPERPLYLLEGMDSNGAWKLKLVDDQTPNVSNESGQLLGWGLSFQ